MAVAELIVSRRALLAAAWAAPAALAAPLRRQGPSPSPTPQDRWIPDQRASQALRSNAETHSRNDDSGAAHSFAVTKCDRASSLPDHPEPDRRGQDDDSGDAQHVESHDAQTFAVTKWDRALARFRRAERIVKAAEGEPDEDRYGILLGRFNDTLRRLLRLPAPHLPALAAKLAAANRHLAWELTGAETCIAALARDAARLAHRPQFRGHNT